MGSIEKFDIPQSDDLQYVDCAGQARQLGCPDAEQFKDTIPGEFRVKEGGKFVNHKMIQKICPSLRFPDQGPPVCSKIATDTGRKITCALGGKAVKDGSGNRINYAIYPVFEN